MTCIPPEPDLDNESLVTFEKYDLLNRKDMGARLTSLVDGVKQPMVIALDGGWGTGKTFFLKVWQKSHASELNGKSKIIYFDAFAHDYIDDPIFSLTNSLVDHNDIKSNSKLLSSANRIKNNVYKLAKPASKVALGIATYGISNSLEGIAGDTLSNISNEGYALSNEYWEKSKNKTDALKDFKKSISNLVTKLSENEPETKKIVFIIDELDRCRPDFSLSILEILKHLFVIENVHFILGVNMNQLQNSVRSRYGSGVNADVYLRKFININVKLPTKNDHIKYFDEMYAKMSLPIDTKYYFDVVIRNISGANEPSLRDIERLLTCISLSKRSYDLKDVPGVKYLYAILTVIRYVNYDLFIGLKYKLCGFDNVMEYFSLSTDLNNILELGKMHDYYVNDRYTIECVLAMFLDRNRYLISCHDSAKNELFGDLPGITISGISSEIFDDIEDFELK